MKQINAAGKVPIYTSVKTRQTLCRNFTLIFYFNFFHHNQFKSKPRKFTKGNMSLVDRFQYV